MLGEMTHGLKLLRNGKPGRLLVNQPVCPAILVKLQESISYDYQKPNEESDHHL